MMMADRRILLSSEAADEMRDLSGRERKEVQRFAQRLTDIDAPPCVHMLNVEGVDEPYYVASAGRFQIVFRYLPPAELPGFEDPRQRDIMIASIKRPPRLTDYLPGSSS
jgi:mRNA-degrading endonuclease RelE of RelBE toxin-antitoxin system